MQDLPSSLLILVRGVFRDQLNQVFRDQLNQVFRDQLSQALQKPRVFNRPHHWYPSVDPPLQYSTEDSMGQSHMVQHGMNKAKSTMVLAEKLHQVFNREQPQECSRLLSKDPNMGPSEDPAMIRLQVLHQRNG
jgi:hypothetical protein